MTRLVLPSGFTFDYTNLVGEGKIAPVLLEQMAKQIKSAGTAINKLRQTGESQGHVSKDGHPEPVLFTRLPYITESGPNTPKLITALQDFGRSLQHQVDTVVSCGIGGSYLGNKLLVDCCGGAFWNQRSAAERDGYPRIYFSGNNLDPKRTQELCDQLKREARYKATHSEQPYRVVLLVISKSGSTLEPLAAFMVLYELLQSLGLAVEVVVLTDQREEYQPTLLQQLAVSRGWQVFAVPDGVGGRFSIFSTVGLISGACIGLDLSAFLAGARAMDQVCQTDDVWQNPALLNASLKYIGAVHYDRWLEVFMPYADDLRSVADWYVQLLAESLGKRHSRDGQIVNYGRTPIVAVGSTDMHAQTQQHQDGRYDKIVQFVQLASWPSTVVIPTSFSELQDFGGLSLNHALDSALLANATALTADNRLNATFILPALTPYHLGELLYLLALSVAYEGELANVDAFDQPGVEAYKRILKSRL